MKKTENKDEEIKQLKLTLRSTFDVFRVVTSR